MKTNQIMRLLLVLSAVVVVIFAPIPIFNACVFWFKWDPQPKELQYLFGLLLTGLLSLVIFLLTYILIIPACRFVVDGTWDWPWQ